MTIGQTASKTKAVLLAAAVLALPTAVRAAPADTYYERAFVVAADARCNLFAPNIEAALAAATAQARGAALRSGTAEAELAAAATRARARAGTVSCADPQLATVRARVDGAFSGWLRTPRMVFPGARRPWTANRVSSADASWRLQQMSVVGASPVAFGYAGKGEAHGLVAVVSFVGRSRPNAARIVLRDPVRVPRPWLAGEGLVPVSARASIWATGVDAADLTLLAEDRRAGEAWRFPASVATAIERLDPRETFAIEFHFRDGSVATAKFEAGDFAAGRAFLAMGLI
ncbi:hypothetical protein [Brevundimonas sp.]|uniref:hypothetical protein n=1 Tax=Brevundimonas sp. TaxID=1871086 RepID=UPI0025C299E5|nr:hypothetical protein [Brevundimonas sp.]